MFESTKLTALLIPDSGGKLQSVVSRDTGSEYIYQNDEHETYEMPQYDMTYEDADFSGADDLFPAVLSGKYPLKPWENIVIPDHGEVWSVPWSYVVSEGRIIMETRGMRFPYILKKTYSFISEDTIHIEYEAENLSHSEFHFIWAAHPLLNCGEGWRIILPPEAQNVISMLPESRRLGGSFSRHSWPVIASGTDLSILNKKNDSIYDKIYVTDSVVNGFCALADTNGFGVRLDFPPDKVPYIGLWINEGGYMGRYHVALEPCAGAYDRLETAYREHKTARLEPGGKYSWWLDMKFGKIF